MKTLLIGVAMAAALPSAAAFAQDAPKKECCCEKMKEKGCCCDKKDGDHAGHDGHGEARQH